MEKCKNCQKQILPGSLFCSYCGTSVFNKGLKRAGLFKRWLAANILDPLILVFTLTIAHWIVLFNGKTPGHALMGMNILKQNGSKSGFGDMLLREIVGKFISALFFGLGFYWAIWDKDRQAWHDKIAGTVVVEKG